MIQIPMRSLTSVIVWLLLRTQRNNKGSETCSHQSLMKEQEKRSRNNLKVKSGSINLQVIEDRRRLIHSLFQTTRDKNRDTLVVNHPLLTRLSESWLTSLKKPKS